MKIFKIILFLMIFTGGNIFVHAQHDVLQLNRAIKPVISTKAGVVATLGKGSKAENSIWYEFDDMSVEIIFSNGKCREDWLIEKDHVVKLSVSFHDAKKLSDLKKTVNLEKLRYRKSLDVGGEKYYSDNKRGVLYGVNDSLNTWPLITYFPSTKYSRLRCQK